MYAFIIAVCARGHVTFYTDNVYVDNVNKGKSDSCHFRGCNI